jgi:hypothetical protein
MVQWMQGDISTRACQDNEVRNISGLRPKGHPRWFPRIAGLGCGSYLPYYSRAEGQPKLVVILLEGYIDVQSPFKTLLAKIDDES